MIILEKGFSSVLFSFRGVGIQMMDPLYLAPSLSDVLFEFVFPQNLPSIVCVHVLDPQPGEIILDMCAAPGEYLMFNA